ncbi:hypothetical protein ACXA45_06025 [Neomicrococcus lactis]
MERLDVLLVDEAWVEVDAPLEPEGLTDVEDAVPDALDALDELEAPDGEPETPGKWLFACGWNGLMTRTNPTATAAATPEIHTAGFLNHTTSSFVFSGML